MNKAEQITKQIHLMQPILSLLGKPQILWDMMNEAAIYIRRVRQEEEEGLIYFFDDGSCLFYHPKYTKRGFTLPDHIVRQLKAELASGSTTKNGEDKPDSVVLEEYAKERNLDFDTPALQLPNIDDTASIH